MKSVLRSLGVESCPLNLDQASRAFRQMAKRARTPLRNRRKRRRVGLQPLSEENPNLTLEWDSVRFCEKLKL